MHLTKLVASDGWTWKKYSCWQTMFTYLQLQFILIYLQINGFIIYTCLIEISIVCTIVFPAPKEEITVFQISWYLLSLFLNKCLLYEIVEKKDLAIKSCEIVYS